MQTSTNLFETHEIPLHWKETFLVNLVSPIIYVHGSSANKSFILLVLLEQLLVLEHSNVPAFPDLQKSAQNQISDRH